MPAAVAMVSLSDDSERDGPAGPVGLRCGQRQQSALHVRSRSTCRRRTGENDAVKRPTESDADEDEARPEWAATSFMAFSQV